MLMICNDINVIFMLYVLVRDYVNVLLIWFLCLSADDTGERCDETGINTAYPTPVGGTPVPKAERTGVGRTLPSGSCFGAQRMGSAPRGSQRSPLIWGGMWQHIPTSMVQLSCLFGGDYELYVYSCLNRN